MNLTLLRILRNACLIITYKVVLRLPQKKKKKKKKKEKKKKVFFKTLYLQCSTSSSIKSCDFIFSNKNNNKDREILR